MKKIFFIAIFIIASFFVNAQSGKGYEGFKIGAGIDVAIPVNNLQGTSIGAGADLLAQYGISENLAITGDVGYTALFAKSGGSTLGLIPIRVGIRFFPSQEFYLGAKVGVGILTGSGSSTSLTAYSFSAGYMISPTLDLGASYDGYSKNGSIGLVNVRLGFSFGNN